MCRETEVVPDNCNQVLQDNLAGENCVIWRVSSLVSFQEQVKLILIGQGQNAEDHTTDHLFVHVITLRNYSLKQVHSLTLHGSLT